MMSLRREVLQSFKLLHRTRQLIFQDDEVALEAGRKKINEEYKKHKHVEENHIIAELLTYSKDVEKELRTSVIQAREVAPGKFEAKITSDTVRMDNFPYNDCEIAKKSEVKKKSN